MPERGRRWPALVVGPAVPPDLAEHLLLALDDQPVTAIHDADDGPWRVFFATHPGRDAALQALCAIPFDPPLTFEPVEVDDEDWARRSQEGLGRVRAGRIVVVPPWEAGDAGSRFPAPASQPSPPRHPIVIIIEPSMGFGTGHHPSTRLALLAMQQIDLAGRSVLDVGTGSGVLAIAARKLGARHVTGVDVDADSLESARVSLALNGVASGIDLRQGDIRDLTGPAADVVVANLTGAFFARHGRDLLRLVRAGGALVASGFTADEEGEVRAGLTGVTVTARLVEDEWVAIGAAGAGNFWRTKASL